MADEKRRDSKRGNGKSEASPWEYVLGAIGALLVVATLIYLAVDGRTDPDSPPDLVVVSERVVPGTDSYIVAVRVDNRGSGTAASVVVRGELRLGDVVVEDAEATLDYVPGQSSRPAALVFTKDPSAHRLVLRALGYDVP